MNQSKQNLSEIFCTLKSSSQDQLVLIEEIFIGLGVSPEDIVVVLKNKINRISVYIQGKRKLQRLEKLLKKIHLKGIFFRIKVIKKENWKAKWAKNFLPFHLTKRFDVVPVWRRRTYKKDRREPIFLASINAFGTGLHETTSFMSRLVERCENRFKSFLDVGTGTGLLSLVALKCGAKTICAVDIDKDCVKSAQENFAINGYSKDNIKQGDIEKLKSKKHFDFVAANLITHDLIRLKKILVSFVAPGGFLAISGISLENLVNIREAFRPLPLRCLKIKKGKQWVAILYKRKNK